MADYAIVTPERVFESLKWNISLLCFAETKNGYKREKKYYASTYIESRK